MPLTVAFPDPFAALAERARKADYALRTAGIPYRIVGGVAVFLHIDQIAPEAARCTPDLSIAVMARDLAGAKSALATAGFETRLHILALNEKVRPEDLEPVPASDPVQTFDGVFIATVADLVRMKLTSFRLKDQLHVQDLDGVGLITQEIEAGLPETLRQRLAEVRAQE